MSNLINLSKEFFSRFKNVFGINIQNSTLASKEKEQSASISGDRDQLILKHILEKDNQVMPMNHASAHLGVNGILKYHDFSKPVSLQDFNPGNERIVFAICPSWGVIFPPYGLAKMIGTLRKENYACKVYDFSVQSYHHVLNKTGIDYWRSEKFFYWQDAWFYEKYIAREIEPFLQKGVDAIKADNPTVVGFSVYSTNVQATLFMVKILRKKLPKLIIVIGGPAVATEAWLLDRDFKQYVNFFFKGEAEDSLLDALKNGTLLQSPKPEGITIGSLDSKIDLDSKAFTDYSDYDLSAYLHKDGVSIETSRGCVAQCSFCSETYFWKFRSMTPERVIDEMKYQIETYGVRRFWFVDSLVNGDLKNFHRLVELIIENKLQIGWNSYSRCDGRMSKEFISQIAESGCTALSYGVESGSQKVLLDMRKKIEVWEIYNNLKDTYTTNKIWTHVNWLIGFPTEENIDFYHSNLLIFNVRQYIHQLSPGMGCGISSLTDIQNRFQLYNIAGKDSPWETRFLGDWFTNGYKNTKLTRFMRVKMFHIWLEILKQHAGSVIENPQRHDDIIHSFTFQTPNQSKEELITPEDCIDFNQINMEMTRSSISASASNDYLAFFYGLFQIFGNFKMTLLFDPKLDVQSWGSMAVNYHAAISFEINDAGDYTCTIDHQLKHYGTTPQMEKEYNKERLFHHGDKSFKDLFNLRGNIHDWKTSHSMVKETIHEVYRNKSKKKVEV